MRSFSGLVVFRASWTGLRPSTWIMGGLLGRGWVQGLLWVSDPGGVGLSPLYFFLGEKWVLAWFGGFAGVLGVFSGCFFVAFATE